MTWVRLDDQLPRHPKVIGDPLVLALYVRSLCYASQYLTDGFVPTGALPGLLEGFAAHQPAHGIDGWRDIMVTRGLWLPARGGVTIHDYLTYNPSKEKVLSGRAASAERQAAHRARNAGSNSVTDDGRNGGSHGPVTASPSPSPIQTETKDKDMSLLPAKTESPNGNGVLRPPESGWSIGQVAERIAYALASGNGVFTKARRRELMALWACRYHLMRSGREKARIHPEDLAKAIARLAENGDDMAMLLWASDGMCESPFNNGDNDSGHKYLSLELLFRNRKKLDHYAEKYDGSGEHPAMAEVRAALKEAFPE